MRIVHNILMGIALVSLLFSIGCCCTGGIDDDEIRPFPHNEGGGDDV